jgi:hypothetical protein
VVLACCVDLPWREVDGEARLLPGGPPSVIAGSAMWHVAFPRLTDGIPVAGADVPGSSNREDATL